MIFIFSLLTMIFLHIVDDYYLQGVLAKMKQKQWWKDNAPDEMYKHDWLAALIAHAFSWTFMIMLPAAAVLWIFKAASAHIVAYFIMFVFNIFVHAIIDHAKANQKDMNLITDQIIHLNQIMMTWLILIVPVLVL